MLTIKNNDVTAAEPTVAALAQAYQGLTYLELRQDYGYEIYRVAAVVNEEDRLKVAVDLNLTFSLSMPAYNKCWRLWNHFPTLEERRERHWR